ncbi:unnamed protein product, partial [Mesorhabditis belari]|uniref:Uncharacterized protein n=1 Tax=Mesorhabditis belari TaxID=2138241 RepID=A0AAF3ET57_9BILA
MIPFGELSPELREMVLQHVGVAEKLELMRCHQYFRDHVFKNGPFPQKVHKLTVSRVPRAPKAKMPEHDDILLEIQTTPEDFIGFMVSPHNIRKMMLFFHGNQRNLSKFQTEHKKTVFALIGKIKFCERIIIDYRVDIANQFVFDKFAQLADCLKLKRHQQRMIYDFALQAPFPVVRQFLNKLEGRVLNSCIVSLTHFDDPRCWLVRNAPDAEMVEVVKKYFENILQKPVLSDCRMFASTNFMDLYSNGLKKANNRMIWSREDTVGSFFGAVETILETGLPNDDALYVIMTGQLQCYTESILEMHATEIGGLFSFEKVGLNSIEAKYMMKLIADPKKHDCHFWNAFNWSCFDGYRDFELDFSGKAKYFYKKRIDSIGKTCVIMVSFQDILENAQMMIHLFKYLPE